MKQQPVVCVVDDDADVRRALRSSIETRGHVVECFASAENFLESYDELRAGCLVLDLQMQGMNGLELQALLAAANVNLPIIFISGKAGVAHSVDAMKAGAVDFLEKPYRAEVLLDRIDDALAQRGRRDLEDAVRRRTRKCLKRLTPRERQVLSLLVESTGSLSSKQIAQQLEISPRTVEHYRANLMSKMQAESLTELVVRASLAVAPCSP